MDHRISKDMISSGMIPSGEKNQEDLGKTQYGTVPSPDALLDVYKSMYEKKEETLNAHHKKDADGNTIPHEGEEINEAPVLAALAPILKIAGKTAVKAGVKLGGKTGGAIAKSIVRNPGAALNKAANVSYGTQMIGSMIPKPSMPSVEKKSTANVSAGSYQAASADLFDIVKGQLLDEGLSEEEIIDIMLTLTPDEIMSEMAVNPNIAAMDAKNKANMIARAQANKTPDKVKEASKRQYTAGGPKDTGANKYTTQDKKTIIDYNKDK